jgi:hypothetical protein
LLLCRFSSSDTIPLARGSWASPTIQLVDGNFSPDGSCFAVADVAGQFSLYGAGPADAVLRAAPYDQFFKKDYDPIMQVTFHGLVGSSCVDASIAASAVSTEGVGDVAECWFAG